MEDVKFVINFDYPSSSEDYIHRIGRTGRSHQTGTAYAFFTPSNAKHAGDLVSVLREANQQVNPRLAEMADMARYGESLNLPYPKPVINTIEYQYKFQSKSLCFELLEEHFIFCYT